MWVYAYLHRWASAWMIVCIVACVDGCMHGRVHGYLSSCIRGFGLLCASNFSWFFNRTIAKKLHVVIHAHAHPSMHTQGRRNWVGRVGSCPPNIWRKSPLGKKKFGAKNKICPLRKICCPPNPKSVPPPLVIVIIILLYVSMEIFHWGGIWAKNFRGGYGQG